MYTKYLGLPEVLSERRLITLRHVFKMSAVGTDAYFELQMSLISGCVSSTLFSARQWRQREFRVGGTKRRRGWGVGEGSGEGTVPPPEKIFCFVISKWHILVNSKFLR